MATIQLGLPAVFLGADAIDNFLLLLLVFCAGLASKAAWVYVRCGGSPL